MTVDNRCGPVEVEWVPTESGRYLVCHARCSGCGQGYGTLVTVPVSEQVDMAERIEAEVLVRVHGSVALPPWAVAW